MTNIKIVKLVNGDDIVCAFPKEQLPDKHALLRIERPLQIKYIPQLTQYLTTNPIIPPEEWKACIREITMDYPEILNIDDSEDNKMWPWYGDLIVDPNSEETKTHVRYPTSFYRKLKKSKKDKLRSSCCGGGKVKTVYNNN